MAQDINVSVCGQDATSILQFGDELLKDVFTQYEKLAADQELPIKEYDEEDDEKADMWVYDEGADMGCISFDDMYETSYRLIYTTGWLIGIHKLFDAVIRLRFKDYPYYESGTSEVLSIFLSPGDCFDIASSLDELFPQTLPSSLEEFYATVTQARDDRQTLEVWSTRVAKTKKKWPYPEPKTVVALAEEEDDEGEEEDDEEGEEEEEAPVEEEAAEEEEVEEEDDSEEAPEEEDDTPEEVEEEDEEEDQ